MSNAGKFLVLIAAIAAPFAFAQTPAIDTADAWSLQPQVQVNSTGIFLDQLLTTKGASPIPHLHIARAPHVGQTISFSRSQVAALAVIGTTDAPATNWEGAATVRISRRMRTLDESELTELLAAVLQKEYVRNQGELEMNLTRAWTTIPVPDEPLNVKVTQMPMRGLSPTFMVNFELWDSKDRIGAYQMPAHASVWRDIPVAHSTLERGQLLKDADIAMERADVLIQRDYLANYPTSNDALEMSEGVTVGHPILSRMVRMRPLILRGQMVEAVFQDGTLGISLMVETLEDGTLGQVVKVRNPKTKRELYGKVESEKSVRISL